MRRKMTAVVVAGTLSMAIAFTGTFAWQSISQEARNEIIRGVNPGGRLHDDFDGENKDVYVENFMGKNEGGVPIFARIRLDEYMETGANAGDASKTADRTPLVSTARLDDVKTWTPHIPGGAPEGCGGGDTEKFHDYWKWTMGGETVFMPTFNKNKDSLSADINGTMAAGFSDYHAYADGETKTGDAYYDADDNDTDEYPATGSAPGAGGVLGVNHTAQAETHTAHKITYKAQVVTMEQWKTLGSPAGPYWVYDVDGWAYWAQAIAPGETTGLLLDKIEYISDSEEPCYYGINVVAQFVTKGAWGSETDPVGFFAPGAGAKPTDDALFLLEQAAGTAPAAPAPDPGTDPAPDPGTDPAPVPDPGTEPVPAPVPDPAEGEGTDDPVPAPESITEE